MTRLARSNGLKFDTTVKKKSTEQNFTYKTTKIWNELPNEIRHADSLPNFKKQAKVWIKNNISI